MCIIRAMAKSVKALINPSMLRWARERSSMTIVLAAEKLKRSVEEMEAWESGAAQPTFKQLMTIANTYKRPITLFYLSEPPADFMPLQDYRRLPGVIPSLVESPQLNIEIRKAHYRRQVALELVQLLGESFPQLQYQATLRGNPEQIGQEVRDLLGISLTEQIGWRDNYKALNGWRRALERLGVLVFQASSIDVSEMRGFTISDRPLPAIVVNKSDSPKGRIFSMMHELAHILLGDSSISGDYTYGYALTPEEKETEVFCNRVAAAILLPLSAFENDNELHRLDIANEWTDANVEMLSKRFTLSREFIWRRLLTRGKISNEIYMQKRSFLAKQWKAQQEEEEPSSGGPKYHIKVLSSIGSFYPELVLNSYYQEKINTSTLSEYLGVKLKHLPQVENAVFGRPI